MTSHDKKRIHPGIIAIASALCFGAAAPFSKTLLAGAEPLVLSGLLYLGCGLTMLLLSPLRRLAAGGAVAEKPLRGSDYGWLALNVAGGGVVAPLLLLLGLRLEPASVASLLLSLEGVATALLAALFFREPVSRRIWSASLLTGAGAAILSLTGSLGDMKPSPGVMLVVAACLFWGLDNNVERRLSVCDPFVVVRVKGLAAGSFSLALAFALNAPLPPLRYIAGGLLLGGLCYGASIVLFMYSLRAQGAARTAAYFAAAPFAGTLLALLFPGEQFTGRLLTAGILLGGGTWLLLRERHEHPHFHPYLIHEHRHEHDEHHRHDHPAGSDSAPHSHPHEHEPLSHSHPHHPDLHHRHH